MKAQQAKEIAYKVEPAQWRYNNIISNIKTLAENGVFRMTIPYPGHEVVKMLIDDGYMLFDSFSDVTPRTIISW